MGKMTDVETHPAGTADLVARLRNAAGIDQMEYPYPMCDEAANRIEQLEAALTRANAATAAAFEVAAEETPYESDRDAILALATPDQTAALDKLIAEAVGPLEDALEEISSYDTGATAGLAYTAKMAILAASKKGGV